jgi:phenylalanyl-tRNA synthetase beta subunit
MLNEMSQRNCLQAASVVLFDLYQSKGLQAGFKSLGIEVTF